MTIKSLWLRNKLKYTMNSLRPHLSPSQSMYLSNKRKPRCLLISHQASSYPTQISSQLTSRSISTSMLRLTPPRNRPFLRPFRTIYGSASATQTIPCTYIRPWTEKSCMVSSMCIRRYGLSMSNHSKGLPVGRMTCMSQIRKTHSESALATRSLSPQPGCLRDPLR